MTAQNKEKKRKDNEQQSDMNEERKKNNRTKSPEHGNERIYSRCMNVMQNFHLFNI